MNVTTIMISLLGLQLILFGVFLYITIKHGYSLLSGVLTLIVCAIAIINMILA